MAAASEATTPDPSIAELIAARPHLRLHAMDGLLLEDVPLNRVADAVGTPTWVYSAGALRARYRALAEALRTAGLDAQIHYAVKANDHLAILALLGREGAGADVVSDGELRRARAAGIPASRIVYSGVGKSERELRLALAEDIGQINVESAEELHMLSALAAAMGRTARVALRVNPDVDAGTHDKISTGRAGDKFGIPWSDAVALYAEAAALPAIEPVGLATHIGSQIMDWRRTAPPSPASPTWSAHCATRATACESSIAAAASAFPTATIPRRSRRVGRRDQGGVPQPRCPPGAGAGPLAGRSGRRAARVGRSAETIGGNRFVVLDAAMNDLVRPAMYDAWHGIVPVAAAAAVAPFAPVTSSARCAKPATPSPASGCCRP